MSETNQGPHFLCIGAQKAGTTWLYENLKSQPGVWLPPVKEIHYLDHKFPSVWKRLTSNASHHKSARQYFHECLRDAAAGSKDARDLSLAWHIAMKARNDEWYDKLFSWSNLRVAGEICPGYARLPADRIRELASRYPSLKIVYMLRDPVDRAWSSVAMHFRKNSDDLITTKAEDLIFRKVLDWKRFGHCSYMSNIENWTKYFPEKQIYFGYFDRLNGDAHGLLADISNFLELDAPQTSGQLAKPVNSGKGERITSSVERRLCSLLLGETQNLHQRLGNTYTARWLDHVQSVLASGAAH